MCVGTGGRGWRERERERQTDRQTDRQTEIFMCRPMFRARGLLLCVSRERDRDRQTRHRERQRETERQTDRQTEGAIQRVREGERMHVMCIGCQMCVDLFTPLADTRPFLHVLPAGCADTVSTPARNPKTVNKVKGTPKKSKAMLNRFCVGVWGGEWGEGGGGQGDIEPKKTSRTLSIAIEVFLVFVF